MGAFDHHQGNGCEHEKKCNDLKDPALPSEQKDRCDEGTKDKITWRFQFQPCLAMFASEVGPTVQIQEERRSYIVAASWALCHETKPFLTSSVSLTGSINRVNRTNGQGRNCCPPKKRAASTKSSAKAFVAPIPSRAFRDGLGIFALKRKDNPDSATMESLT